MAEALLKNVMADGKVEILSRGLVVLFPEPVNPKAEDIVKSHGLSMQIHTTKQFRSQEVDEKTLVLTMTYQQKYIIQRDYLIENNIFTMKEFVEEFGDVIDPYGQSMLVYEECYQELARLARKTMYKLMKNEE